MSLKNTINLVITFFAALWDIIYGIFYSIMFFNIEQIFEIFDWFVKTYGGVFGPIFYFLKDRICNNNQNFLRSVNSVIIKFDVSLYMSWLCNTWRLFKISVLYIWFLQILNFHFFLVGALFNLKEGLLAWNKPLKHYYSD